MQEWAGLAHKLLSLEVAQPNMPVKGIQYGQSPVLWRRFISWGVVI